jgi:uncharacterized oxidoreductase
MDLSSNTVLITGGASGIGFALAERFLRAGSEVAVCGRREEQLRAARTKHPVLKTRVCDLSKEPERRALAEWAARELPKLNVLVNNAGIQRRIDLASEREWEPMRQEIAINLEAPIHLSSLFIPQLLGQQRPAIVNITSGLAFVPLAQVPIYSATKAAMHSFSVSLRQQLSGTPIRVVEIAPPAVDTDLGGPGLHSFGTPVDEFADAAVAGLAAGDEEIAYGFALQASRGTREERRALFTRMNLRADV